MIVQGLGGERLEFYGFDVMLTRSIVYTAASVVLYVASCPHCWPEFHAAVDAAINEALSDGLPGEDCR